MTLQLLTWGSLIPFFNHQREPIPKGFQCELQQLLRFGLNPVLFQRRSQKSPIVGIGLRQAFDLA
jgi:hypothetical protein